MTHEVLSNLAILGMLAVPTMAALTALWIGARRRAERAEAVVHQLAQRALASRGDVNLSASPDLQQAIDALAVEVERLAEGQRFVSRVLTERPPMPRVAPEPSRSITPH